MKQIKTFNRAINDLNDVEINKFLSDHKVLKVSTHVIQGFKISDNFVDRTYFPMIITTIVYEVEK